MNANRLVTCIRFGHKTRLDGSCRRCGAGSGTILELDNALAVWVDKINDQADEIEQLRAAVEAATGWLAEDSPEWEMCAQALYKDDAKFPPGTVGSLGRNDTERLTALTAINIDLRLRIAELEAENARLSERNEFLESDPALKVLQRALNRAAGRA